MLATAIVMAAVSFFLSRPAVGTAAKEMSGATAVPVAKLLGRS
jgi:hypothetical protein